MLAVVGLALGGQERYEYDPAGRLIRFVDSTNRVTEYGYDPAGNILSVSNTTAAALAPSLSGITPSVIRRGESLPITLTGQRLQTGTLQGSHPGLVLSNVQRASTQVTADLTVAASVPTGEQTLTYANSVGSTQIAFTVAPLLPTVTVEPSPLALPPDGVTRGVTLRLSNADLVPHTVAIASSDTSKGTVSPASLVLAAGQTTAQISVTPKVAGFFSLNLTSTTLKPASVPVFVTTDFRGVNTSYAQPVGVRVGEVSAPPPRTAQGNFGATGVGVAVGSVITGAAPAGVTVGGTHELTVRGFGIPAGAQVAVVPPQGITPAVTSQANNQLGVSLQVEANAAAGWRRIEVRDATGKAIPYASAEAGLIQITTGQPEILSIDPLFAERNRVVTLKLRGRHLQNGRITLSPSTDLRVDAAPVISADGTEMTAKVEIVALAATGARLVQVTTPSGSSTAQVSAANQFTIVSEITANVTPIASPLVGVQVGSSTTAPTPSAFGPLVAQVGVLVGQGARSLAPKAGVIGTSVTIEVAGAGLQAVQSAVLQPADGLTLGAATASADGLRLSLPVTIAADAPRSVRRLVLTSASGRVAFSQPEGDQFAVVAPVPEFSSTSPQVWLAGQTVAVTVQGRNLSGVQAIALQPGGGVNIVAPYTVNAEGTQLNFNAQLAADAASGPRTLVITTAAGSSAPEASPANTVQIARQLGGAVTPIASPLVGLVVGTTAPPPAAPLGVLANAAAVGVMVNTIAQPVNRLETPHARPVGVVVGAATRRVDPAAPDGFLKGSSGVVEVQGIALGAVTQVSVTGTGVTAGTPTANTDGTRLTVPITVAADAPSGGYALRLSAPAGAGTTQLATVDASALQFNVGALPTAFNSTSPIVLEQGKTVTLTVRGVGLRDVYTLAFEPAAGITVGPAGAALVWSTDSFGEKLTVPVFVEPGAAIGSRVLRLRVPGASTDAQATPANTVTIVAPQ
ncbi:RHS repeat domain-containing protein [Hydrogenophaga sp.]|uniref:RHS repeat domain-containing protein n=1 Tax=Hydrogenophaga sp. TaxID=1904254 RepID=UPI00272FD7BF|nr:RHS repeat domain-containing protein [Hydrogenophaga sp.]MDP2073694.1 RHS repeat domain-containing protein [Hydrogenophaga sp.]MDP3107253.1 RHS repeat domain-containing protein [Hydrogenophaga sp.]